ncbi:MAG TPA: hypothetical protein VNQ77_01815 [Frankiaceae bacterium]|nr:hypothetical protein [Frankiaceae bacterium]
MRTSVLGALGLVTVLALPASAAQGTGPFSGDVAQGETDTHVYDNHPGTNPCLQITATYVVTLTYLPGSDTLTLGVPGKTATGQNGSASATVTRGICTEFPITVTGTSVASGTTYVVSVTRQVIPPIVAS